MRVILVILFIALSISCERKTEQIKPVICDDGRIICSDGDLLRCNAGEWVVIYECECGCAYGDLSAICAPCEGE